MSQGISDLEMHLKTQQEGKTINLYISSNGVYLYYYDPAAEFIFNMIVNYLLVCCWLLLLVQEEYRFDNTRKLCI